VLTRPTVAVNCLPPSAVSDS